MASTLELTTAMKKLTNAKAMLKLAKTNYIEAQQQLKEAEQKYRRQQARDRAIAALKAFRQRKSAPSSNLALTPVRKSPLPPSPQPERPDTVLSIGSETSEGITITFLPIHPVHKTVLSNSSNHSALFLAEEGEEEVDKEVLHIMEENDDSANGTESFKHTNPHPPTAPAIVKQPEHSVKKISLPEIHLPNTPEYNRIIQTKLMGQEAAKVELKNFRTSKHHSFPRNLPEIKLFNTVADVVQYFKNTSRCTPDHPNSLKLAHYEHFDNIFPRANEKFKKML